MADPAADRRWWLSVAVGSIVAALLVVPVVLRVEPARTAGAGAVATTPVSPVSLRLGRVDGARVEVSVTGAPAGARLEVVPPTGPARNHPLSAADSAGQRSGTVDLPGSGRYVVAVRAADGATLTSLVVQR